jgi:hypothetical protein
MSSRNRVIYQSEALYISEDASSTGSFDHVQLERVQSANYSFNISRQDINQYGQLARIDSVVLEAPTVSFDMTYYLTNGFNEQALKFSANDAFSVGFASGHLVSSSGQNVYIVTSADGTDANQSNSTPTSIISLGNMYVSDYTIDASVGSIPTASVSMEGVNIRAQSEGISGSLTGVHAGRQASLGSPVTIQHSGLSGILTPGVNQELGTSLHANPVVMLPPLTTGTSSSITALRPGDVKVTFGNAALNDGANVDNGPIVQLTGAGSAHVQSVSLNVGLSRSPIERLGSKFPFARVVDFPVNASFSVSAIVGETTARNLSTIIDNQAGVDCQVSFFEPGSTSTAQASFKIINAKLDSESFSSSIGSNKTVDLTFSTQIGGPIDTTNNVLFSGNFQKDNDVAFATPTDMFTGAFDGDGDSQ